MKRKKEDLQTIDIPFKVRMSLPEAEAIARLKDSPEWGVYKQVAERYVENLMKSSFNLNPSSPSLAVKHADYASQAFGIKYMARLVDKMQVEKFIKDNKDASTKS